MRKLGFILAALSIFLALPVEAAGPRAYGKRGTATGANATITLPFHPIMICIRNDDAANGLYFDWTDGVASAVDESSNLYLTPGESNCFSFIANKSPFESFTIGVLSTAASTVYHINASRGN